MKKHTNFTLSKFIIGLASIFTSQFTQAQCATTPVSGDWTVSSDIILSGTYSVTGTFRVANNVTVYVKGFASGGCGKLEIYAQKIIIDGAIDGNSAGNLGGAGGLGGNAVTSITGDQSAINTCSNKDNTGVLLIEGGKFGASGAGTGAGLQGQNGQTGSGPKQQCLNNDDECGMIGSASGAGGGGGGSYGGAGTSGGAGGNGTNTYTATGVNVSTGYVVVGGAGGAGGNSGAVYGTANATDIALGSGGAGAGGGGRSYDVGLAGGKGGNGGGLVKLVAVDSVKVIGKIYVNGENGTNGGNAGNGGISPNCCSDGCDDPGEATLSCGAGAGSGSGGGSGGGIYIETQTIALLTGTLQTKGGNGGNGGINGIGTTANYSGSVFCGSETITSGNGFAGNKGGAGGGGRIKIFVPSCTSSSISATYSVTGGTSVSSAAPGTYEVICTANGIKENEKEQYALTVFPNPALSYVTIKFKYDLTPENISDITILNTLGETVKTFSSEELKNTNSIMLDLSDISAGIYFIKTTINHLSYDYKIIKQ